MQEPTTTTYELYLDESGDFEKFSRDRHREAQQHPIKLVGGVLVPPLLWSKAESLREELMAIRKDFFPKRTRVTHIHISDSDLPPQRKSQLRESLLAFFKKRMPQAKVVFVYDLEELTEESPLGAQRYRQMLLLLLRSLLFYHPEFPEDADFQVKVAHRRVEYPAAYDRGLADQGYLKLKGADGLTQFTAITEADLRTILTLEQTALRFPCRKQASFLLRPYAQWDNPFMTMADTVCNLVLRDFIELVNSSGTGTGPLSADIHRQILGTFGQGQILFYCPSDYDFPYHLLETFHQKKPGEFFAEYIASRRIGAGCDSLLLHPAVRKTVGSLRQGDDPEEYYHLIRLANAYLDARLFHELELIGYLLQVANAGLASRMDGSAGPEWNLVIYLYHTAELRYHNHRGNVIQAIAHRDAGEKIFQTLPHRDLQQLRDHHGFLNAASVADTNEFAFTRAIARLEPLKQAEEEVWKVFSGGQAAIKNETLGKIYGSLAQNYAFAGEHAQAQKYFTKAAQHLGQDDSLQTSFRAHLALDMENVAAYQKEMASRLKLYAFPGFATAARLCIESLPKAAFDLHLSLKGMLVFSKNLQDQRDPIYAIEKAIFPRLQRHPQQHPWELVFTTLGRLLCRLGDTYRGGQYFQAAAHFTENPEELTLLMIGHAARAWEALTCMVGNDLSEVKKLLDPIQETFKLLADKNCALGTFNFSHLRNYDEELRPGWFDGVGRQILAVHAGLSKEQLRSLLEQFIGQFTFNYW